MATQKGKTDDTADLLAGLTDDQKGQTAFRQRVEKKLQDSKLGVVDLLSETREKLDSADVKTNREAILNATHDSVLENKTKYGKDLASVMAALRKLMDGVGVGFEGIRDHSPEEQGWIDDAKAMLEGAKAELKRVNAIPDSWWQRLWGRTGKIETAQTALSEAESGIDTAETRAKAHYEQRLENAELEESLQRMITMVTLIANFVESKMADIDTELTAVTESQKSVLELKEKAAQAMEDIDAKLKILGNKLKAKLEEKSQYTPGTAEYTRFEAELESISNEEVELKGKLEVARAIFNSKERFVDLHGLAIEALTTQKHNLKGDLAALKSDTQERESFYAATIQSIKAAAYQKITSQFEKVGVKTDIQNAQMLASHAVASERSRMERVEAQGPRMEEIAEKMIAFAEGMRIHREKDAEVWKAMHNNYGLDIDPTFIVGGSDGTGNSAAKAGGNSGQPSKGDVNKELEGMLG